MSRDNSPSPSSMGPPPFSTSTLTSPIFTSTLPLPRTASDSVLPTRRMSAQRHQRSMARRQKRTRSAASSVASQSSSESDRDDIDGFSMGDFSIDLARLGGSFVNGVKGAVNESAITVPKRKNDQVESEDEGPTDFTMNLEEYMRGAKTWRGKGKGIEEESKHEDEIVHEDGKQDEEIKEKEDEVEGVYDQEDLSVLPDDIEDSVIHKDPRAQTLPPPRLNAEALQDRAAQEVFTQISALQTEVERLRLEAEDHRAEKLALEEDHLRLTDQNEDMAFEIQAADQVIAALEAQNRAQAEEFESKMEKNRENATRFGSLRSKFEPVAQELDVARREIEVAKRETEAAKKEAEVSKKEAENARKEVEMAKQETGAIGKEAEAAKEELKATQMEREAAKTETEATKIKMDVMNQELEALKKENDTVKEVVDATRQEAEVMKREMEALKEEMEALRLEKKSTEDQAGAAKQDADAKTANLTEQLRISEEKAAKAATDNAETLCQHQQAATECDRLRSELSQCKQDISNQLEASEACEYDLRSTIKSLQARLRTVDESTPNSTTLRNELEQTQEQLSETRRILETVEEENDRLTRGNERQLEEVEFTKAELLATRRSASENVERREMAEGEIEKIREEIEELQTQKEGADTHISDLTELNRIKELHQEELEAARASHSSEENSNEDDRLADELDRVSGHYETELATLKATHEAEVKKLKSTLLRAAEGMKKREDRLAKAHAEALSSLQRQIETLEEEKSALPAPPTPSAETITALTSTLSTTQHDLSHTRTALQTTQTALQHTQQLLLSQQADHEAVNAALEARFSEVMEKREKEWRRRIGILLKEREKMGRALMWGWGKEEVGLEKGEGEGEGGNGKGGERRMGYRYMYGGRKGEGVKAG